MEDTLKGNWLKSVLLSMLAAFLYTLVLIGVVIVLKRAGVDLLSIVQTTPPTSST